MAVISLKLKPIHIERANSEQFLTPVDKIPSNPSLAVADAKRRIRKAGWSIKTKPIGSNWSTTFPKTLWLDDDFHKRTLEEQAMTLYHEYTHVKQWNKIGFFTMLKRLASTRGRWSVEMPAYRMTIRVAEKLYGGAWGKNNYVDNKLRSFYKSYRFFQIKWRNYEKHTRDVWEKEF